MTTPQWAIVLRPWEDEPVFHRFGGRKGPLPITLGVDITACGREIDGKPSLPYKHVVKFARPCRGCFPS